MENGIYRAKRASAGYFGLVEAAGADYLSVSEGWIRALHSENETSFELHVRMQFKSHLYISSFFEAYGNKCFLQRNG